VIGGEIRRLDRVCRVSGFMRPHELELKPIESRPSSTVCALVEAEWRAREIRFILNIAPGLPTIEGDEEMLRQASLTWSRTHVRPCRRAVWSRLGRGPNSICFVSRWQTREWG